MAWWLRRWSVNVRVGASILSLVSFAYIMATSTDRENAVAAAKPAPVQSPSAPVAVPSAPREDEAAWVVLRCKPDKDTTKTEGGQPIRHLVFRKANVELMYAHGSLDTAWQLVGRFKANKDEQFTERETARRLPCATGHLATVLER